MGLTLFYGIFFMFILNVGILCIIMWAPQNIVMDLNNVMLLLGLFSWLPSVNNVCHIIMHISTPKQGVGGDNILGAHCLPIPLESTFRSQHCNEMTTRLVWKASSVGKEMDISKRHDDYNYSETLFSSRMVYIVGHTTIGFHSVSFTIQMPTLFIMVDVHQL